MREIVPLLSSFSQLGLVQLLGVLEKEVIICKPSSSVHTWTDFQHLSPILSVWQTQINIQNETHHYQQLSSFCFSFNNSFWKKKKELKYHLQQSSCGISFPFFVLPFLHLWLIVTRHVCSYAKLSKFWVQFTSHLVMVQWGRAVRLVVSLLGFTQVLAHCDALYSIPSTQSLNWQLPFVTFYKMYSELMKLSLF